MCKGRIKTSVLVLAVVMMLTSLTGCAKDNTEINVFIAASLSKAMDEVAKAYNEEHPEVSIIYNADSSGTLMTQIQEGYECDIFFSAASKQMDILEEDGLIIAGTRHDVISNQLCVLTYKGSGTKVTGLKDIGNAASIALADGSVPAGMYTRQALARLGVPGITDGEADDVFRYSTSDIQKALGAAVISEQTSASKVIMALTEHSCEVGTAYYSDTYGHEDDIEVIEKVDTELTGEIVYPVAQIVNKEADEAEAAAAADFASFIMSDEAKSIFRKYLFIVE